MRKSFSNFGWGTSSFSIEVIENQTITLPIKSHMDSEKLTLFQEKNADFPDGKSNPCGNIGNIDFDFMESFIRELEEERIRELTAYLTVSGLADATLTANERSALKKFDRLEWQTFRMEDLFEKVSTAKLPYKAADLPKEPTVENSLPCLTSSFMNQGLNYYAPKNGATILKNVISIPSNSDVYRAYYQSQDFTVLSDAYAIRWNFNDFEISSKEYLFMVACINQVTNLPIYSYKNKLGVWNVVKNKSIVLPVVDGIPNLNIMQDFISAVQKLVIKDVVQYADEKIATTKEVVEEKTC